MFQRIKEILASWFQSLKILTPAHGKLFFLVTIKTIYETYKILFRKFWWLFLLCIGFDILYKVYSYSFSTYNEICAISLLLWSILGFVTFLTVRPSIALKDYEYYSSYFWHFIYFMMITSSFRLFWLLIVWGSRWSHLLIPYHFFSIIFVAAITLLFVSPALYLSPFWMMLIFCSLDSEKNNMAQIKSLWRGIKMIFYNYPFFIIITIIAGYGWLLTLDCILAMLLLFSDMLGGVNGKILYSIADDLTTLLLPIFFCIVSNFYIKQVHEEFKRYF